MHFTGPFDFEFLVEREWILTNGLGSYTSSTLCGLNSRRYHGLLVAALNPPGERTLLVAKVEETIQVSNKSYPLSTNQYPGTYHPLGYQYLTGVDVQDTAVNMRFEAGGAVLEKQIAMDHGANTTRLQYRNTGTVPFELTLTPLVNARNFHGDTHAGDLNFTVAPDRWLQGPAVQVKPNWMPGGYWLFADAGDFREEQAWYYKMTYFWERRRGLGAQEDHFSPGHFHHTLWAGEGITLVLSTEHPPAEKVELAPRLQVPELPRGFESEPPEVQQLARTAQSFIVTRAHVDHERTVKGRTVIAGYHWFGDWGRDTMIALPGLCLCTKRYAEAADILRTFAAARRRGLLPNLFLDSGKGEAYNTVDASLWFVHAVDRHYQLTRDRMLLAELRPALEEIIHYYRNGTDYDIGMDSDGLVFANAEGWQLTWMDAKVNDFVVTPRSGKPVEINALWYNALRVMEAFAHELGWDDHYGKLAEQVRRSFTAFWYEDGKYLYDVLGKEPDARLRPNQIFAVSLPHSPLDMNRAQCVVEAVERHLLTPYGLRTLAPFDPDYRGHYAGNQWDRDTAYHQGTIWPWLIGGYVDAYLRVHGHTPQAKSLARALLKPLLEHMGDAGINSISEIFEGSPPHLPRGTISQAWSVSEVLRAWLECRQNTG